MSWNTFHNRGETLGVVVDTANDRRDGLLPMSVPGVVENFTDELDLIGGLLLKWHARLSGNIERALLREPMDLESAVASAWQTTAEQMPGVRMVIDRCVEQPEGRDMERAMNRAREHEWVFLATAAGLASSQDVAAAAAGRRLEGRARTRLAAPVAAPVAVAASASLAVAEPVAVTAPETATESFVDRIKAVLAA